MRNTVAEIIEIIRAQGNKTVSENGICNTRMHHNSERYAVDFAPDFKSEGWMQFDIDQDARYFGVWVNPSKRFILSYAEGDWCLTEAPTTEAYNDEIRQMCEFYGEGFIMKSFDFGTGETTTFAQDRSKFFISV